MSKQKSLCVTNVTLLDLLLSLQGITAHRRTLFKTCSKSQSLESKQKPSTFSAKMLVFLLSSTGLAETVVALATYSLTSVRYTTVVAVYQNVLTVCLKRAHKSWVLSISDPPRVLSKHFGGSLIAATQSAFVRTLFKTCSQLQRLDVKRSFSNTLWSVSKAHLPLRRLLRLLLL